MNNQRGFMVMVVAIFFLVISASLIASVNLFASQTVKTVRQSSDSMRAYFLAESGSEDAIYRLRATKTTPNNFDVMLDGQTAVVVLADVDQNKEVVSAASVGEVSRQVKNLLAIGSGASFNFGVQSDEGGFIMENNSVIEGNLYSNGSIIGLNSGLVRGDVVSAGPAGLVEGVIATGTAYAHAIKNSTIGKDAYYQTILMTSVGGAQHPNSPDQATSSLPISDSQIEQWESDAEAGGVINCLEGQTVYKITDEITLGPVKINCDLEISGNHYDVTLAGSVWVSGDLTVKNSPTFKVLPSVGARSLAIIADKPSDRLNSGKISLDNSSSFYGSGKPGSYVLMISQNRSAEEGGSNVAINVANSANGDILVYAGHGEIKLGNSVELKQVTAYRIRLSNFSVVRYAIGLASVLFTSGPGGTWKILEWKQI